MATLKQQNGHLTQVEVNEMLRLMSHVTAKVPPNDAVPGWVILLVKLLGGTKNRKFFFFFLKGLSGTLHGVLLHVLRHVGIFDHCLSVRHGCPGKPKHSGEFIIFTGTLARTQYR
uniref:Uncharacterized protein n=1 Tax=Pundamilia nyererei TaxID=303518 RepID=A0A3B4FJH4_9CICH